MPPFYGLSNTNKKPIISNLLKCQETFYNINNKNRLGLGKEAIIMCKTSIYYNNSGTFDINAITLDNSTKGCCNNDNDYVGKLFSSQSTYVNKSRQFRYAAYVKSSQGGRPVFVFSNFNQPYIVNYLGRLEGQYGGSGAPLRNTF
jgi:hypothetical protein